jgi:hypothetical protein
LLPLEITEMLPNPTGSDDGNEFIELFNPNSVQVNLSDYRFMVGSNGVKYEFPVGSTINSNQYLSFLNNNIKFTLVNTTSSVKLISSDGQQIDESPIYNNPSDGMAWALINNLWQYTNQPTPGMANLATLVSPEITITASNNLEPCAPNQYRNPETNRCKLISTSTSTSSLLPCKVGQYRSEETNRCRSIVSDVSQLIPCAEGQERNPATNRCRSIAKVLGASTLAPCKAGQERNPETNRCRNIVSKVPTADYAPQQANESSNNPVLVWSLVSVGAIAICYGIWEWRQEIIGFVKKFRIGIGRKG